MLLHRCASFVAKALALQVSANAFPAGSSAFVAALLPQESRGQPGRECVDSIKDRSLLVSYRIKIVTTNRRDLSLKDPKCKAAKGKDMLLHRCASFVANESGTARARGKRPPGAQDPV